MRIREINVPSEIMFDVAKVIGEHEIVNEIKGVTEEEEIIMELQYEKEENQIVFEVMELIDEYNEEDDDEDE